MTLDSLPDLEYKRVVSCKDSFHGTDVLAVSEHGAPGRRPALRRSPKGGRPRYPRQTEALSSRNGARLRVPLRRNREHADHPSEDPVARGDGEPGGESWIQDRERVHRGGPPAFSVDHGGLD